MLKHRGPVSEEATGWAERPANYETLDRDDKEMIDNLIGSEGLQRYYLTLTHNRNPRRWAALQQDGDVRTKPGRIVQGLWENGDVFFLRQALIKIVNEWENLCPEAGPCPVSFDEKDMALYSHEEENRGYVGEVLTMFRNNWGLSPDGSIEASKFHEMQGKLLEMREAFVAGAGNEEDRMLADKLWPY